MTSGHAGVVPDDMAQLIELFFFAYRDFTGDADAILEELGFGRAHHRVLHFVSRYPDLRVADLLVILKITKQSLARVLRELVERGLIAQTAGHKDRRERRLSVTGDGHKLMRQLMQAQAARIGAAAAHAGPEATAAARRLLVAMIAPEARRAVSALIDAPHLALGRNRETP